MRGLRRWLECRFVRGAVGAYLDGETPHLAARLQAHLARCPRCREFAETLAAQARLIESLSPDWEPQPGFAARVMQRIAAAQSRAVPPSRAGLRRLRLIAVSAGAAAALAAALWALLPRAPHAVQPTPRAPVKVAQQPPARQLKAAPPVSVEQPPPTQAKPVSSRVVVVRRAPARAPVAAPQEQAPAPAQELRESGRSYEEQGHMEQALQAYAAAREQGGSQMARLDVARVYEKAGYTAQALDELVQVAFAEVDEDNWEPLALE